MVKITSAVRKYRVGAEHAKITTSRELTKTISFLIKTQIHLKYVWHWYLVSVSSLQLETGHLNVFLCGILLGSGSAFASNRDILIKISSLIWITAYVVNPLF